MVNEDLRALHFERITDERARKMYNLLCEACEKREGGVTDADQMLVADVATAEQIKQLLLDDIAANGIGRERSNGRQKYYQENKAVAQARAYSDQQRKHLAELRLTPNSRKATTETVDDDLSDF